MNWAVALARTVSFGIGILLDEMNAARERTAVLRLKGCCYAATAKVRLAALMRITVETIAVSKRA
jgi:hypothetical protein